MIDIKINGEPLKYATSWDDVSFRKYLELVGKPGTYETLGVMLERPPEFFKKAHIEGLEDLIRRSNFLQKTPVILETPERFGNYTFPKDITFESIEQFEETRAEIERVTREGDLKEKTKSLALLCAIYIQPQWDGGQYDGDRARVIAEKIMDFPCLEVMTLGNFMQAKSIALRSDLSMTYLRRNIPMKKNRPALRRLMRLLDFMRR